MTSRVVAVAGALVALWTAQAVAQPVVIGPGKERAALALVRPYVDEGPITDGVKLAGLRIEQRRIAVIISGAGSVAEIRLEPLSAAARSEQGRAFRAVPPADVPDSLRPAVDAILAAVAHNDDGRFFVDNSGSQAASAPAQATPANPHDSHRRAQEALAAAAEDADFDLWGGGRARLAALCWLLVLVALAGALASVARAIVLGPSRGRTLLMAFAAFVVFVVALRARDQPMWPLHANNHAYEDIAAALGGPDSGAAAQRHVAAYGPAWLVAQRAMTDVFGGDHDGLGAAAAMWGAAAAVLALAAAFGAGGSLWWSGALGLTVAALDATVAVGHSESTLVIAQWLVAACLLLATRRSITARVGVLAGLWLLVDGHAVGPPLAGGVAALCCALSMPARPKLAIGWGAGLAALPVLGLAMRLGAPASEASARLAETVGVVPVPSDPFSFSLWLLWSDHAAALVLAGLGVVAIAVRPDERERWHRLAASAAAAVGLLAIGAAGLLVCACLTDALRYQSTLMAPVIVLGALASHVALGRSMAVRFAATAVVAVLVVTSAVGAKRFAEKAVDTQIQSYLALRDAATDALPTDRPVFLLDLARTSARGAVLEVPRGQLKAGGVTLRGLRIESFEAMCAGNLPLPGPVYAWLAPPCAIDADASGLAEPCRRALKYRKAGPKVVTVRATLPPLGPRELSPKGLRREFLDLPQGPLSWSLDEVDCQP